MPPRLDIESVFVIGSGPIVIGQGCEFDYSGTQAVRALKEEGYRVVLVNSNPATIMTDPELADRTYIEPLTVASISKILEEEKPDVLLPTVGGQTALNLAVQLAESGILRQYGVKLIGATCDAIKTAEDRRLFRQAMASINIDLPRSTLVSTLRDAEDASNDLGFPIIARPSFTLGGEGGGIAYNIQELRDIVANGISASPINEVLLEECLVGWKEFELEVMRDHKDNAVVVCSIENIDPMGVHTGDSITVAPAMTLTDREYQRLRDIALAVIRRVGVDTGGSNIQFAVHPETGRTVVIEMNPRVSRSSALASKATGFPIARIAAKLAVGHTLDELPNAITLKTPACFEPTLDYVAVKIPRWDFAKFPRTSDALTSTMRSVGETMALGRTFTEALQKGLRSLEIGRAGLGADGSEEHDIEHLRERLSTPNPDRIFHIRNALLAGWGPAQVHGLTKIAPFFIDQIQMIVDQEAEIEASTGAALSPETLLAAKRRGFSDQQIAILVGSDETTIRSTRIEHSIRAAYKTVDTCGAEFDADTPYHYSTYGEESETTRSKRRSVVVLGGGPNRIGQGIEFDYCCVHAVQTIRQAGYDAIMVNNNPETVSTDFDVSDKLYFEPLTLEDVLEVTSAEDPLGVIVQLGGQTPLNLAQALKAAGVKILGTDPDCIDLAEDRKRFGALLHDLGIPRADDGTATNLEEAERVADRIGYPVLVRPSYVLGGRAMAIVYDRATLDHYISHATRSSPNHPILIDRFLEDAFEVDVDALADGESVVIGGIMQHIEEAGIHSGDSACVLPPARIPSNHLDTIRDYTRRLGLALDVRGLLNIQFAIKDDVVYVIEVNPRASRTVPFVSKATGVPLAKIATRVMLGERLKDLECDAEISPAHICVKEAVLPFKRFPGSDIILGPEMRATGEVMGCSRDFGMAFSKANLAAGTILPLRGAVFVSVNDNDKESIVAIARELSELGFQIVATCGTAARLRQAGLATIDCQKIAEGRPHVVDHLKNGAIDLIINTPLGKAAYEDEVTMRRAALDLDVPTITTLSGAAAAVQAIRSLRANRLDVHCLQDLYDA